MEIVLKVNAAEIAVIVRLLGDTVGRITAVSANLSNEQLQYKPDKKTWSAHEVLAHLRACADVWGTTITEMLEQDNPILPYLHPRDRLKQTDYLELEFHESLATFGQQRQTLLAELETLEITSWTRSTTIKGRQHTVFSQARRLALHEQGHCEQIEGLLG